MQDDGVNEVDLTTGLPVRPVVIGVLSRLVGLLRCTEGGTPGWTAEREHFRELYGEELSRPMEGRWLVGSRRRLNLMGSLDDRTAVLERRSALVVWGYMYMSYLMARGADPLYVCILNVHVGEVDAVQRAWRVPLIRELLCNHQPSGHP